MTKAGFNKGALVAALAICGLPLGTSALASPVFTAGLNQITTQDFEIGLRPYTGAAGTTCTGCLPNDPTQDPPGFRRIDPTIANNLLKGDLLVGIITINGISPSNWVGSATDQFSGYFASQIDSISPPPDPWDATQTNLSHIVLTAPTTDPFGILGAGEQFALFTQSGGGTTVFTSTGPTLLSDIQAATDGTKWGTLGTGAVGATGAVDTDGFLYTHADISRVLGNFAGTSFFGVNFVQNNSGLSLNRINDLSESEEGGNSSFVPASGKCANPDPILGGPVACTDIIGFTTLSLNQASFVVGGQSQWVFGSGDDMFLNVSVPEPGTLSLFALALLGLGGLNSRLRRKG
jgi:hypothetical protein